jgi:hypothetical protein
MEIIVDKMAVAVVMVVARYIADGRAWVGGDGGNMVVAVAVAVARGGGGVGGGGGGDGCVDGVGRS